MQSRFINSRGGRFGRGGPNSRRVPLFRINTSQGDDDLRRYDISDLGEYHPRPKRVCASSSNGLQRHRSPPVKGSSIGVLPDECLFEILRRLAPHERCSCASISKRWLAILTTMSMADFSSRSLHKVPVNGGRHTRKLSGGQATDSTLAAIAVCTAIRGGLGNLYIQGNESTRVTDHGLKAITHCCPSLKVLSLSNISSIGNEGLSMTADGCRLLKELELSHMASIGDKGLIAIAENCSELTSLSIDSCPNFGNETLLAFVRHCPKLESISIKNCPLIGDLGVASSLSPPSPVLTKIKLHGLKISDMSLASIGHYANSITDLSLVALDCVTTTGFWAMANGQGLRSLTSLTISSYKGVTDEILEIIGNGFPNLKNLCLWRSCFLSDGGLLTLSKSATSLESLQLELCDGITLEGVMCAISKFQSQLRSLFLVGCAGISDMPVAYHMLSPSRTVESLSVKECSGFGSCSLDLLGKICPMLQHLNLNGLHGITDDGVLSFLESRKVKLETLNLQGCINLTDTAVAAVASGHSSALKVLNLAGCEKITDDALLAIASRCILLEDLNVSHSQVSNSGIAAMARRKKLIRLRFLSLSGCTKITNKCITSLKRLGQNLVRLNLQGCPSINGKGINSLVPALPWCEILH